MIKALNLAEALLHAARCGDCAFFDRGECRAWPPLPMYSDGRAVWPKVSVDQWCAAWRPQ